MARKRRALAALALLVVCAPGTLLRSEASWDPPDRVAITPLSFDRDTAAPGWEVAGVWQLSAEGLLFGGFSALVALPDNRLMAFSDRSARLIFDELDRPSPRLDVTRQRLLPSRINDTADIEAAAIDPASGTYWLAFENDHSIDRFAGDHTPNGVRDMGALAKALDWYGNGGAEAFTRLADGRFMLLPEAQRIGLIFARDPVLTARQAQFTYRAPVAGHGATDMAQLPDGRVLLLLRNVDLGSSGVEFESRIAIGPVPEPGKVWAPQITLDLDGMVPRENYEGIAVRAQSDGRVAVWLIADDNLSVMQRTLVVKLLLDPDKAKGARK
jgi:hypothetical protein